MANLDATFERGQPLAMLRFSALAIERLENLRSSGKHFAEQGKGGGTLNDFPFGGNDFLWKLGAMTPMPPPLQDPRR